LEVERFAFSLSQEAFCEASALASAMSFSTIWEIRPLTFTREEGSWAAIPEIWYVRCLHSKYQRLVSTVQRDFDCF